MWQHLIINDQTFCTNRHTLNYVKAKGYLANVGHHIKRISIQTKLHFDALYQLLILLQWFTRHELNKCNENNRLLFGVKQFSFKFPCDAPLHIRQDGIQLFGIGGMDLKNN